jgi:aldose 1-epimerase
MTTTPSGEQFEISLGQQTATIVEVGGGIRSYTDAGRPVLNPYPEHAMCDGAHGAPLVPWPNRLADGRYRFDGVDYQVALTEPEKHNAIHGFLHWRSWQCAQQTESSVTMANRLYPLQGYPFTLDVSVEYALGENGLTVTTTASNGGDTALPYGYGQHPYLSAGPAADGEAGLIDDCTLTFDAATRIATDADRQLPTGTEATAGTAFDFRAGRRLGDLAIDFAFTDLARDEEGLAWVRLAGVDGRTAEFWVDETFALVELYTGDTLAPGRQRTGLGTEPMTCPPNAFATGERVIRLEPGQTHATRWGSRLR